MKYIFIFLFVTISFRLSLPHILRLSECALYDAIFSQITYHNRLIGNILTLIEMISLRKCLTRCVYSSGCFSVNYMRENEKCELVGDAAQQNSTGSVSFEEADGWNHFETNYNITTVSAVQILL